MGPPFSIRRAADHSPAKLSCSPISPRMGWRAFPHRAGVAGRRVPTYGDGQDFCRLDGMDLMTCKDAAATNRLTPSLLA